ncbi:MAG: acsA2 [Deltaproteobacteria bacterium]|nr:acsA2 [Deltaproteobacteria bacterium]
MSDRPLWQPSPERAAATQLHAFRLAVERRFATSLPDYPALHAWSIAQRAEFWSALWDFCGVVGERGERVVEDADRMPGARWFPDARLNFAENLLRRRDGTPALIARDERGGRRTLTWAALHDEVSRVAQALRALGVRPGDRVAGYLPNGIEAIVAMLAAASLGAIWSSCSPDFGVQGVVDRFGQIEPRVLFACDGYAYGGKTHDVRERVAAVLASLPSVQRCVVTGNLAARPALAGLRDATSWNEFTGRFAPEPLAFERLPFDHPLYILYSSGTTGAPKCIVHGAGGTLLQHLKEQRLHTDLRAGDRFFYYTTTGWMMWNWLASGLASEATLVLFDGSPFQPGPEALFDLAAEEQVAVLGVSAKFLDSVRKSALRPIETHDLSRVRAILSTGSPLAPESFEFVYDAIARDVQLASISGGTDIVSCFLCGDPSGAVWRGECQRPGLGMAVDVFDDAGQPVREGAGELVCTKPFPSMPVGFWNDADGTRYRAAYFERFPGVWHHGDFVEWTAHGGMVIHGRSDATLNPGGVRIGTAEIYRQVEQQGEVVEAIVIGQPWQNDVRVVLFVRLREGLVLDDALREKIKQRIRANTTPRHVPAVIAQVADIPRTRSGKIVELAVRDVVAGSEVKNREALANPEALELFRNRTELAT